MNPPTATPRTQALWMKHHAFFTEEEATEALCDFRDHGNLLETELAAAKGECERLKFATEGHLLKTIQQQAELARLRAQNDQFSDNLSAVGKAYNAEKDRAEKAETELARLRAEFAVAENWVDDLIGENVRLRADLERFTGHGLLDCHAICDQRDTAVAERDRLRAEVEALKQSIESGQRVLREDAERNAARAERAEAEVERLTKQIKDDNRAYGCELRDPNGTIWEQAAKDHARAEKAEAECLEQARLLGKSGEREAALLSALKLMVSKFDAFIDSEYCGTDLLAEQLAQADFARKVIMGEARK